MIDYVVRFLGWLVLLTIAVLGTWVAVVHIHNKWRAIRLDRQIKDATANLPPGGFTYLITRDGIEIIDSGIGAEFWDARLSVQMKLGEVHSKIIPLSAFPEADRKVLEDLEAP